MEKEELIKKWRPDFPDVAQIKRNKEFESDIKILLIDTARDAFIFALDYNINDDYNTIFDKYWKSKRT